MMKAPKKQSLQPLGQFTARILDPLMRQKVGLNVDLLEHWGDIVGMDYAETTLPLQIRWPHRRSQMDAYEPGTLVLACEGFAALKLSHETTEIISRINGFFGFFAIDKIKIEQKPVRMAKETKVKPPQLSKDQEQWLEEAVQGIDDEKLRHTLIALGRGVLSDQQRETNKKFSK